MVVVVAGEALVEGEVLLEDGCALEPGEEEGEAAIVGRDVIRPTDGAVGEGACEMPDRLQLGIRGGRRILEDAVEQGDGRGAAVFEHGEGLFDFSEVRRPGREQDRLLLGADPAKQGNVRDVGGGDLVTHEERIEGIEELAVEGRGAEQNAA